MIAIDDVAAVLRRIRIGGAVLRESELQRMLATALLAAEMRPLVTEYPFGPQCRADIWIDGIVIEVKLLRPRAVAVAAQLSRYARQPGVRGVILVLERAMPLPDTLEGVPCRVVSLRAGWGVAV